MAPGVPIFSVLICAESMKRLRRKGSPFDRLITPTLKAACSNPVGRTKSLLCFVTAETLFYLRFINDML